MPNCVPLLLIKEQQPGPLHSHPAVPTRRTEAGANLCILAKLHCLSTREEFRFVPRKVALQ
jgi:hypothetical protein